MATSLTVEGIVYAATQDASTNANTMDDYEEGSGGTFTVASGGINAQSWLYTKWGKMVTFWGSVTYTGDNSHAAHLSGGLVFLATTASFGSSFPNGVQPDSGSGPPICQIANQANAIYTYSYTTDGLNTTHQSAGNLGITTTYGV